MSIATLKRKSQAKYNNMSVGHKQFSLNGTTRSPGYVGQTSLSRSLPRTLFRGATARGYGGCCGTYRRTNVQTDIVCLNLNDNTVVKPSVINNTGMIATHYRWIRRPQPFAVVKPDTTLNMNDQQSYIEHVQKKAIQDYNTCNASNYAKGSITKNVPAKCCNNTIKGFFRTNYTKINNNYITISKPETDFVADSQSDHILTLQNKCSNLDEFNTVNKNIQKTPFACGLA